MTDISKAILSQTKEFLRKEFPFIEKSTLSDVSNSIRTSLIRNHLILLAKIEKKLDELQSQEEENQPPASSASNKTAFFESCYAKLRRCYLSKFTTDFIKASLARHKVPKYIEFVKSFPMNAAGKILKYKMREEATERLGLKKSGK